MDSRAELTVDLSGESTTTEASDTDSEVVDALRRNKLFMSSASYMRTDPGFAVAPSRFKSKLTIFCINWMILRRLFVPQAATYRTSCRTIIEGFVFGLLTYNVMFHCLPHRHSCCFRLDLVLPLGHGMNAPEVVMIAGDVICRSGVKNPIIGRSISQCHKDRDHQVWQRFRDWVGIYD